MPFDLTIGTERAQALQDAIQEELAQRGYSAEADPVMAEYITIMLINNKTAEQITAELEDLIGASEYDATFTSWLFAEAARRTTEPDTALQSPATERDKPASAPVRDAPPHVAPRAPSGPRAGAGVYQQALSQAIPTTSPSHKRTASARSPSPNGTNGPNKARKTDLPTGPRAMVHRDGARDAGAGGSVTGSRSLLERVGGRRNPNGNGHRDEIQARIDTITNHTADQMQMMGAFNGGMGIPNMNMMGGNMMGAGMMPDMSAAVNPIALQDIMMNQMALMAQMANNMGMLNAQGQFPAQNGFPMNGGFGEGGMFPQQQQGMNVGNRRGGAGGRGRGRGGSPAQWSSTNMEDNSNPATSSTIAAPAPQSASSSSTPSQPPPSTITTTPTATATAGTATLGYTPPSRPQSPTLCKFGLKCTNALCRYSHPSPVSTPESGIVLSNDACPAGKGCVDKDCIKAHVSPAVANPAAHVPVQHKPEPVVQSKAQVPCRYGAACVRVGNGCPFSHHSPSTTAHNSNSHFNQQCRFGAGCTRAACPFQHPPGRVLPSTFHRGLSATAPVVSVPTPGAGTVGAGRESHHKSVVFNKPKTKEVEERKEAEKKKENAEAAEVEAAVIPNETKIVEAAA